MEAHKPPVRWAQRKDRILLSVYVTDIHDEKFDLDGNKFRFSGVGGNNQKYSCELELYKEVVPEESRHRKTGMELFFDIKKKEEGPFWPYLLNTKKEPFIKVDFNRWKDEDESDSEDEGGRGGGAGGIESLMQNMDMGAMGGLGGMGGMMRGAGGMGMGNDKFDPGDISDDSDDEEMPDLEPQ